MSEYTDFCAKYPMVSFNDVPGKRNKNHYLFALETYCIYPSNFDERVIEKYKGVITWNKKLYEKYKDKYNCYYLDWFTRFADNSFLENFTEYEKK